MRSRAYFDANNLTIIKFVFPSPSQQSGGVQRRVLGWETFELLRTADHVVGEIDTLIYPDEARFSGCLIGQCLGDALGFPVEGHTPELCGQYVRDWIRKWGKNPEAEQLDVIGQYTDDSQLAREMIQSFIGQGEFDADDYARRIACIFAENRIVGRGMATDEAASRLADDVHWKIAGCPPLAAGNGSAMRAGPVGMFYFNDVDRMIRASCDQSWITHQDPRCQAGSVAIAGAVALVLTDRFEGNEQFTNQLAIWVEPIHREFADIVGQLAQWVLLKPSVAAEAIGSAGKSENVGGPHARHGASSTAADDAAISDLMRLLRPRCGLAMTESSAM